MSVHIYTVVCKKCSTVLCIFAVLAHSETFAAMATSSAVCMCKAYGSC